jgi:hypothetical protein
MNYQTLATRAAGKGIKTFGDVEQALKMSMEDMFGPQVDTEDPEALSKTPLYNCDAAIVCLEYLAEDQLI